MKPKHLYRATALLATVLAIMALTGAANADVFTDKIVYQAGETVLITGDGMQANESVGIDVSYPDGSLAQHHDVLADDQGNFADSYTLPSDPPSGDYSLVATGAQSGSSFSTTFDPIGAGSLNCPTLTVHNPTHYKLQVGTTVTCTIDGASEVSGETTTTVFIKSTPLGNTEVTGTVTGTGDATQITFTYTARGDGCDTTVVAYDKVGTNSNNIIISGDPVHPSAAGFAYVDGQGNVIDCGGGGEAHVTITKVADAPSVYAGENIGFTITVSSDGTGTALNVQVSDTLPTDTGTSWSIDGGTGAADCGISLGVLTCDFGDMAAFSSLDVHISSPTTVTTAKESPVVNTASVTSDNAGSGDSTDQVEVICPRLGLSVKADSGAVLMGDPAGFNMTVTRKLHGMVDDIWLSATLPRNLVWTVDGGNGQALCTVTGSTLSCYLDEMDEGMSYAVHVSAVTTRIGKLTARATTSGPSSYSYVSAKASITVG